MGDFRDDVLLQKGIGSWFIGPENRRRTLIISFLYNLTASVVRRFLGLHGPEYNAGTPLRLSHTILSFYCPLLQSPITSKVSLLGISFVTVFLSFPLSGFRVDQVSDECYFIFPMEWFKCLLVDNQIFCMRLDFM